MKINGIKELPHRPLEVKQKCAGKTKNPARPVLTARSAAQDQYPELDTAGFVSVLREASGARHDAQCDQERRRLQPRGQIEADSYPLRSVQLDHLTRYLLLAY